GAEIHTEDEATRRRPDNRLDSVAPSKLAPPLEAPKQLPARDVPHPDCIVLTVRRQEALPVRREGQSDIRPLAPPECPDEFARRGIPQVDLLLPPIHGGDR